MGTDEASLAVDHVFPGGGSMGCVPNNFQIIAPEVVRAVVGPRLTALDVSHRVVM